ARGARGAGIHSGGRAEAQAPSQIPLPGRLRLSQRAACGYLRVSCRFVKVSGLAESRLSTTSTAFSPDPGTTSGRQTGPKSRPPRWVEKLFGGQKPPFELALPGGSGLKHAPDRVPEAPCHRSGAARSPSAW